jgi:hypothetical protein
MRQIECRIIQELLPLYAENLVSEETAEDIKEHLAGCTSCALEWEDFIQPLPDPLALNKEAPEKGMENRFLNRLKKTVGAVVLLVAISGAGLAYASYTAGRHVGADDPAYRFAKELGLFTEIKQKKNIDGIQVELDKGLFDSTRSVLFLSFSERASDFPQLNLTDESGRQYEQKRGKGWQNKYFMFEFEPLELDTQEIQVSLATSPQTPGIAEFSIPVDVTKTARYTTIVYPNQEKTHSNLRITLDKAVLGVSETEFRVRFDWPVDGSVAGIGLDRGTAYFPTSIIKAPDTPPPPGMGVLPPGGLRSAYSATYGLYYRPEDPPENRPALYDLTARQEVPAEEGEYRTTQFPCQVMAILKFAPVNQKVKELELLLPPVYLYHKVESSPKLHLSFKGKVELNLEKNVALPQGKLIIEKAWLEEDQLFLSYRLESTLDPVTLLPHFELTDTRGERQGRMRFDRENTQVIIFALYSKDTEEFMLNLDSMGQLQPREKFAVNLGESDI